ncbi:MAG: PAS domain S-box protein [Candidatus Acidiferrales bacterium]
MLFVFLMGEFRASVLSGVRAYVASEGLWSRAEKEAVQSLLKYSQSRSESDYRDYLSEIAVLVGDRQAREEMEKSDPDLRVVTRGLLQGRNHPGDIPGMIRLFRWVRHDRYMAEAIATWTEGDRYIDQLQERAAELHEAVQSGRASPETIRSLLSQIDAIDARLTPLENQFSFILGVGARVMTRVSAGATLICTLVLLVLGALLSNLLLARIRQSDEKYRHLVATANDAILVTDAATDIVLEANRKAEEMLGASHDQLIGKHQSEFFHRDGDEAAKYSQFLAQASSEGSAITEEVRLCDSAGRLIPVEWSASRTEWPGRTVIHSNFRDIRKRLQAEELLRRSEERFRSLIQNLSDIILVLRPDGHIAYGSPSVDRMLDYKPAELANRNLMDYVHDEDAPALRENLQKIAARSEIVTVPVFRCLRADGSWLWLEALGTNLIEDPTVQGIVLTARDVTERLRLEEQVRQAQKMDALGRLAGGIAHDFNNLLMIVQGHADTVRAELSPSDALRKNADTILKAADRAAGLTRRLLAFGRKQIFAPKALDLNSLISEIDSMLRSLLTADIDLELSLSPGLGHVTADPGQIEQVLMNLVVNARDAMPLGGRLTVKTANEDVHPRRQSSRSAVPAGRYVVLAVCDTGCGMDPQTLNHIFEPFFTTKAKDKGTGLGLAVVYGIVKQSGGHIDVSSEPNRGSEFRIFLPRSSGRPESPAECEDSTPALTGRETILVAEDESDLRTMVCDFLGARGYTVLAAADGNEAASLSTRYPGPIDLLLTDIVMPGMRGSELAKHVTSARLETKVLYMSGYAGNSLPSNGDVAEERVVVMLKPFRLQDLAKRIEKVLRDASERRQIREA